jgi:hypothetical protein
MNTVHVYIFVQYGEGIQENVAAFTEEQASSYYKNYL